MSVVARAKALQKRQRREQRAGVRVTPAGAWVLWAFAFRPDDDVGWALAEPGAKALRLAQPLHYSAITAVTSMYAIAR